MEMEFVQGVRLSESSAREAGAIAREKDISLSSHAPYFVNLCTDDKTKLANSKRHIKSAARITSLAGGGITVFHPGFYQKLSPDEAYKRAKGNLAAISEELESEGIQVRLGAETVGKKSAFGGLMENIRLSQEVGLVEPVIDFAHLHARGDMRFEKEDDYRSLFSLLEKELGDYVRRFHSHFSEINYSEKGERNHFVLGTNGEPPYEPLMKVLAENGYSGTIICETPQIEGDALKMQGEYMRSRKGK